MDITDFYIKKRCNFGRQPMFSMVEAEMIDSINPDRMLQKQFCLRNPVNHEVQVNKPVSAHEINTPIAQMINQGINHSEGGWPREIHVNNEEETLRHRRRIEREDPYCHAVMKLTPKLEYFISQNNAIDMYQVYYNDIPKMGAPEKPYVKLGNIYRDEFKRPVSSMSWTIDEDPKLVVSYCNKDYPPKRLCEHDEDEYVCYIWEMETCDTPAMELHPPCACWEVVCSPTDPGLIVGGLADGRVCVFDIRARKAPISISLPHLAHQEPVSSLLYMHSRLNNEFFTGSSDGQCMWYDFRYLDKPLDYLIISVKVAPNETATLTESEAVSTLSFERSFPTKFLCGTDSGLVINVNRKGKTYSDIMSAVFKAHLGPVRSLHRSPCTLKMFLTCGDWTTHIWSDDVRDFPIIYGMTHRYQVMDAVWAPNRYSGYMTVAADGRFRYWDLLHKGYKPWVSLPLAKVPLSKMKAHEDGRLVAVGDVGGLIYMTMLSENLVISGPHDKQLMLQVYEREYRREHILESRLKELRLKQRLDEEGGGAEPEAVHTINEDALVREAEEQYRKQVIDEFRNMGGLHSAARLDTMRIR